MSERNPQATLAAAPSTEDTPSEADGGRNPGVGSGILSTIGSTPLIRFERLFPQLSQRFYGKLEFLNPGGSLKDRPALRMLERGLESGRIAAGGTVIESSSGNMGIGLAMACRYLDLRLICVVDVKTTATNLKILRALGAEADVVTEPHPETGDYLDARLARVEELLAAHPGAFWPNQYGNAANPEAHAVATAVEIVDDLGRPPGVLLAATSTCGTVAGIQDYLTEIGADTRLVAVDAEGSAIFGHEPRKRIIPGLGSSREPGLLEPETVDAHHVTSRECVVGCRLLARREAILAGGSSGGLVMAARRIAATVPPETEIVLVLPDRGGRYMDTVFCDDWVTEHIGDPATLLEAFDG